MWRCVREEKGTIIVLFALLIVFMIGLVGLSADTGFIYHQRSLLQNAADAAALAGAYRLPNTANAFGAATQYANLNGITEADTVNVTFSGNKVKVQITRDAPLFFAQILGFHTFKVYAQATARAIRGGFAFDYALFHGDLNQPLEINGGTEIIQGNGHSNYNTVVKGSALMVTGVMESVGTFTGTGPKIDIGAIENNASVIDMPDFSSLIKTQPSQYYNSNAVFNGSMNVNGNIYADGSITFNGGKIDGLGTAMATGNIDVNNDNSYTSSEDGVCLYSLNGDITINGGSYGTTVNGILYAPNGTVRFNGTKVTINGAIIAKDIIFNGVKVTINYDAHSVYAVPTNGVELIE